MKVKVGVCNRHIHLSQKDFETLFGSDAKLTERNKLVQTGEFACNETLNVRNEFGHIDNVILIAPFREFSHIEISVTDSYLFKIKPKITAIKMFDDTPCLELIGSKGKIMCPVIINQRHIHINKIESEKYGLHNGELVSIKFGGIKGGILNNVFIKVKDNSVFECHLDRDDANALLINNGDYVEIIKEEKNDRVE